MVETANIEGFVAPAVKGILIDRDPPITAGFCGDDTCLHKSHVNRRRAQAGAEKRRKK